MTLLEKAEKELEEPFYLVTPNFEKQSYQEIVNNALETHTRRFKTLLNEAKITHDKIKSLEADAKTREFEDLEDFYANLRDILREACAFTTKSSKKTLEEITETQTSIREIRMARSLRAYHYLKAALVTSAKNAKILALSLIGCSPENWREILEAETNSLMKHGKTIQFLTDEISDRNTKVLALLQSLRYQRFVLNLTNKRIIASLEENTPWGDALDAIAEKVQGKNKA